MKRYLLPTFLVLTFSQQASAYLDPGTCSLILQGLIAGLALAGFTIKSYWYRIKAFFGKSSSDSLLDADEDTDAEESTR